MKDNENEIFPIVDNNGVVVGSATRGECHSGSMILHPVVHLHILNSRGEIYLQLRPSWKDIQPNKWDTAVGGHIDYGESVEEALSREVFEELGVSDFTPIFVNALPHRYEKESEFVNLFYAIYDGDITPSMELADGRFWNKGEIVNNLGKGVFTPNFEEDFALISNIF